LIVPSVDCWSLLGIPRGTSADEVKNAYARRVRDVHPDAGGTGDGLTLSLLKAARDEALSQVGRYDVVPPMPTRSARPPKQPKVRGRPCNVCGQRMPRGQLDFYRIHAGFNGRPKSSVVLVCASCTHVVAADQEKREQQKLIVLFGFVVAMAGFVLLFGLIQASVQ
jgi:hypothetical protein